ncbi:MAG: MFS transporter [Actinomycetia bacterium]|nr:MFS transporter [Actinomycetes bacterium]
MTRQDRAPGILAPDVRWLTVGILTVITLVAFEAMAVATAMPVAVADLDGLPSYAWAFSGYLVTSLVAMVVAGEVCDERGPRGPLVVGLAVFGVGLVVAGAAPGMAVFVLGRALQGVGGGAIIVAIYVVVGRAYESERRPRLFAALSSAWVLPSIIGPVIAGAVAERLTWRLVFLAVPVLLVAPAVLLVPRLVALEGGQPGGRAGRKRAAVAGAAGLALVQYGLQRLDGLGVVSLVVGAALLVPTVTLLLPPGTLRFARGLPTSIAMRGVLAGSFFGAETFVPLMLVTERGLSATLAGLTLTGSALGWAVGSWHQGRPTTATPRERLVQGGSAIVAGSIAGVALVLAPAVPAVVAAVAWSIGGLGMGLGMASIAVAVLELSPVEDQGANSAALQVCDALFSVVFIGVGGAVYAYAHSRADLQTAGFVVIFAAMALLAGLGALMAPRLRPAAVPSAGGGPAAPRT